MKPAPANRTAGGRVRVLPEVVQNKIAAGEVIERPAAAVKELVENSLDAGARAVAVEIEEGGQRLIRVSDDGCGMGPEDLAAAILRHATSKIHDVDDIFQIATMGFRGEALPSIGAVSRLKLTSCPAGQPTGHQIAVEAGAVGPITPAPPRPGTVAESRDLFFITPARRKFMKSPAAETAAIAETLTRLALAHPGVAFRLDNHGRRSLDLPAHNSLAERLGCLFGRDLAGRLAAVDHDTGAGLRIEGFIARPPESRANSSGIYLFLNHRWIRHPGLARVTADACAGRLPPRRYPFGVFYLELDPAQVDVNVHPAKFEVRFENERLVIGALRRAVEKALQISFAEGPSAGAAAAQSPAAAEPGGATSARAAHDPLAPLPEHAPAFTPRAALSETELEGVPPAMPTGGLRAAEAALAYREVRGPERWSRPAPVRGPETAFAPDRHRAGAPASEPQAAAGDAAPEAQAALDWRNLTPARLLGQAGQRYLVLDDPAGIKLIDQHALHERLNYDRLRQGQTPGGRQALALPQEFELTAVQAARGEELCELLQTQGFSAELAESRLLVRAIPSFLRPPAAAAVVRELLDDPESDAAEARREKLHRSLACRSAALFGQPLAPRQVQELVERHEASGKALTCPHGRPVAALLTWEELAKRFDR